MLYPLVVWLFHRILRILWILAVHMIYDTTRGATAGNFFGKEGKPISLRCITNVFKFLSIVGVFGLNEELWGKGWLVAITEILVYLSDDLFTSQVYEFFSVKPINIAWTEVNYDECFTWTCYPTKRKRKNSPMFPYFPLVWQSIWAVWKSQWSSLWKYWVSKRRDTRKW